MMTFSSSSKWDKLRVLDGGFGSTLEALGFNNQDSRLWSAAALLDRPDLVLQTHKKFIEAGCDVILTNSYQANIDLLIQDRQMTQDEANQVIKKSVNLGQQAIAECAKPYTIDLIGSVGSYATRLCDYSEYHGKYIDKVDEKVIIEHYMKQSLPLLNAGLDLLAFETISSAREAMLILQAVDQLSLSKSPSEFTFWISFACKDGEHTNHGELLADAIKGIMDHQRLFGIGINCTPPSFITPLLQCIQSININKPLIVYPNSGETYDCTNGQWLTSPIEYANMEQLDEWRKLGVKLFGGCCRVSPEVIHQISKCIAKMNAQE